jgi:hypothetical protein
VFDLSRRYVDAVLPLNVGRDEMGLGGAGDESAIW